MPARSASPATHRHPPLLRSHREELGARPVPVGLAQRGNDPAPVLTLVENQGLARAQPVTICDNCPSERPRCQFTPFHARPAPVEFDVRGVEERLP